MSSSSPYCDEFSSKSPESFTSSPDACEISSDLSETSPLESLVSSSINSDESSFVLTSSPSLVKSVLSSSSSSKNSDGLMSLTSIGFSNISSSTFSTSTKSEGPISSGLTSFSFSFCFSASSANSLSRAKRNSSAFFSASRRLFSANFLASSDLRFSSSRVFLIDFSTNSNNFLRPKSLFLYQSVDHKW